MKKLDRVEILEFNHEDANVSAKLELECEQKGKIVSRIDSMIAAMAINRNAYLFTFNEKHFLAFSKLKLL